MRSSCSERRVWVPAGVLSVAPATAALRAQQCEMLPHTQLALILQSYLFFFPSVFFRLMSCCQSPY